MENVEGSGSIPFRDFIDQHVLQPLAEETEKLQRRLACEELEPAQRKGLTTLYELAISLRVDKAAWRFYTREPDSRGNIVEKETELGSVIQVYKTLQAVESF